MPVPPKEPSTLTIVNASSFQDTDWSAEIIRSNALKKGLYRCQWTLETGGYLYLERGSMIDHSGTIWRADFRVYIIAGTFTSSSFAWVTMDDDGTFDKVTTNPMTGNYDYSKNGWYSGTARVVAYWDKVNIHEVNTHSGVQV